MARFRFGSGEKAEVFHSLPGTASGRASAGDVPVFRNIHSKPVRR